jgi:hypothetical protein
MSTQTGTYFIGTYGYNIVINLGADITGATGVSLQLRKPLGSLLTKNLTTSSITAFNPGSVTYTTAQADVDQVGAYNFELLVQIGAAKQITTEGYFTVASGIDPGTLVVEDGTGLANANSYATLAEGNDYNGMHLYGDGWFKAPPATRTKALVTATRVIDVQVQFDGYRASTTQALAWPRIYAPYRELEQPYLYAAGIIQGMIAFGATGVYGVFWPSDAVPIPVKAATCELARVLIEGGDRTKDDPTKGISSLSLGSGAFAVTFNPEDRRAVLPDIVAQILAPLGTVKSKEGFKHVFRT